MTATVIVVSLAFPIHLCGFSSFIRYGLDEVLFALLFSVLYILYITETFPRHPCVTNIK